MKFSCTDHILDANVKISCTSLDKLMIVFFLIATSITVNWLVMRYLRYFHSRKCTDSAGTL